MQDRKARTASSHQFRPSNGSPKGTHLWAPMGMQHCISGAVWAMDTLYPCYTGCNFGYFISLGLVSS